MVERAEQVHRIYELALELGAKGIAPPTVAHRTRDHIVFGCYFRDLDGNKLFIVSFIPPEEAADHGVSFGHLPIIPYALYPDGVVAA